MATDLRSKVLQLVRLLGDKASSLDDDGGDAAFFREAFCKEASDARLAKGLDGVTLAEVAGGGLSEQALVESLCSSMSEDLLLQYHDALCLVTDDEDEGDDSTESYEVSFDVRLPDYTVSNPRSPPPAALTFQWNPLLPSLGHRSPSSFSVVDPCLVFLSYFSGRKRQSGRWDSREKDSAS